MNGMMTGNLSRARYCLLRFRFVAAFSCRERSFIVFLQTDADT